MAITPSLVTPSPVEPSIVSVLAAAARLPLAEAAAAYTTVGLAVFPCAPGAKRPLTRHGYLDATIDAAQVNTWWRRWPDANIGLPTGRTDGQILGGIGGFDVLDIDVHPGGTGFPALARTRRARLVDGWAYLVRTPSGGLHLYYPASMERGQASWSLAGAHVDFRGLGGYVIAPPSRVLTADGNKRGYTPIATGCGLHPLDATAVRHLLAPLPRRAGLVRPMSHADVVGRLGAWLANQPEGNRNQALFWAGCRVAEAGVAQAEARDALGSVAARTGLDEHEITATLASAYRTTLRRPTANGPPPVAMGRPGP